MGRVTQPFMRGGQCRELELKGMSVCVLGEVSMNHEMPAGFGEIKGNVFRERRT